MPIDPSLLQAWGPWFFIAYILLRDLLPFLRDRFFPAMLKEREDDTDRKWLLSERQVQAQENIAEGVQAIKVILAALDARSQVTAGGTQRIEVIVTEINTRLRNPDTRPIPIVPPKKRVRQS